MPNYCTLTLAQVADAATATCLSDANHTGSYPKHFFLQGDELVYLVRQVRLAAQHALQHGVLVAVIRARVLALHGAPRHVLQVPARVDGAAASMSAIIVAVRPRDSSGSEQPN
jgi:hypothetical protein